MSTVTQLLWRTAGKPPGDGETAGICRVCGQENIGLPFDDWVRPTFTDWDKLVPGDILCQPCQFAFEERSELLTKAIGKWWATDTEATAANPDRVEAWQKRHKIDTIPTPQDIKLTWEWNGWCIPQRMRNYSHFVVGGEWVPLSKGNKAQMRDILLNESPTVAVIAESGQKHIIFRAVPGVIQFEEQQIPDWCGLGPLLDIVEILYSGGFSKGEIETGDYAQHQILRFGLVGWWKWEEILRRHRRTLLFSLALFLAQKSEKGEQDGKDRRIESNAPASSGAAGSSVAGNTGQLQEPLSQEHLAAVRGQREVGSLHQQPGQVHQLAMFESER